MEEKITDNINTDNKIHLEQMKKYKVYKKASFARDLNRCYEEWPICIYDQENKYRIAKYFYFTVHPDKVNIIVDYFY